MTMQQRRMLEYTLRSDTHNGIGHPYALFFRQSFPVRVESFFSNHSLLDVLPNPATSALDASPERVRAPARNNTGTTRAITAIEPSLRLFRKGRVLASRCRPALASSNSSGMVNRHILRLACALRMARCQKV